MFRILIAEDDYASRRIIQKIISNYGDCFIASDGLEAIQIYREVVEEGLLFDLFILDIMMPNIDGITVLKMIREEEKKKKMPFTEALFLTVLDDLNIITLAKNLDARVFKKPLTLTELNGFLHKIFINSPE